MPPLVRKGVGATASFAKTPLGSTDNVTLMRAEIDSSPDEVVGIAVFRLRAADFASGNFAQWSLHAVRAALKRIPKSYVRDVRIGSQADIAARACNVRYWG